MNCGTVIYIHRECVHFRSSTHGYICLCTKKIILEMVILILQDLSVSSQYEIHFGIAWHPEWDEHKNHQGKVCLLLLFLLYSGVNLVKVCCIRNVKNSCAACSRPPIIDE